MSLPGPSVSQRLARDSHPGITGEIFVQIIKLSKTLANIYCLLGWDLANASSIPQEALLTQVISN